MSENSQRKSSKHAPFAPGGNPLLSSTIKPETRDFLLQAFEDDLEEAAARIADKLVKRFAPEDGSVSAKEFQEALA